MSVPSYEARREAEAALGARRDLGPEYEAQIAASLAQRVEEAVSQRQREQGAMSDRVELARINDEGSSRAQRFALAIVSLGTGIPITAISGELVHPSQLGVGLAWAGIVAVNVAFGLGGRRRR